MTKPMKHPGVLHPTRQRNGRSIDFESTKQLAKPFIADLLGPGATVISGMSEGVSSVNFLVEHGIAKYVMRLEVFRELEDVRTDVRLADECRNFGVHVPDSPVYVDDWMGLPTLVRPYMPGVALNFMEHIPATLTRRAGRELGQVHSADLAEGRRWFYADAVANPEGIAVEPVGIVGEALDTVLSLPAEVGELLHARIGLVHTDFKADNLVSNDRALIVLDWEKATSGPLLFDLALSLFHLLGLPDQDGAQLSARAFLEGYLSTASVDREELDALPELVLHAASIFFLIDSEIVARTAGAPERSPIDLRHRGYYQNYCKPTYLRARGRITDFRQALSQVHFDRPSSGSSIGRR